MKERGELLPDKELTALKRERARLVKLQLDGWTTKRYLQIEEIDCQITHLRQTITNLGQPAGLTSQFSLESTRGPEGNGRFRK